MKKIILLLSIIVFISIGFGVKSYSKAKSFEDNLSYFQSNNSEVLTSYRIDNVNDIDEVIKLSSNINLLIQISNNSNNNDERYITRTIDYFINQFNNELVKALDGSNVSIDELNVQLSVFQSILKWYFGFDNDNYKELSFKEMLKTLNLEDELIDKLSY